MCREEARQLGLDLVFGQSNDEGQLIDWIQEAGAEVQAGGAIGAVFNPGALHPHVGGAARRDRGRAACRWWRCYISNVHRREPFRHRSYVSPVARGIAVGFGVYGYVLGLRGLRHAVHGGLTRQAGRSPVSTRFQPAVRVQAVLVVGAGGGSATAAPPWAANASRAACLSCSGGTSSVSAATWARRSSAWWPMKLSQA